MADKYRQVSPPSLIWNLVATRWFLQSQSLPYSSDVQDFVQQNLPVQRRNGALG